MDASERPQHLVCESALNRRVERRAEIAGDNGEMQGYIAIARVVRPQGRKGEVLAKILTDFPSRFAGLQRAFLDVPDGDPEAIAVEHTWLHKGRVVMKFDGIASISDAETLRGRNVLIPKEEVVALPAHQYYLWELEGCHVVVESGGTRKPLGTVTEVERTGGTDILHVADGSEDVLVPFARAICKVIDPEARLIVIDPPEDLLDLNREQVAPPQDR